MSAGTTAELELADWRRRVAQLYAEVRDDPAPEQAHDRWRAGRDALFRQHPQSPLAADSPLRESGLPYWPYDPALRFEVALEPPRPDVRALELPTGDDVTRLHSIGRVVLPEPLVGEVEVWWMEQYAGGVFLPLRDGSSGRTSYGGGRYLLDTSKGADLGARDGRLVLDLNFLYHPSCRYDDAWLCPLAPPENTIAAAVEAGERMEWPG